MTLNEKKSWQMTCMEALMSRAHGCAGATLEELEGML
jgi:hypothetical protein